MTRLKKITCHGMALYLVSSLVIPALHLAFAHHRHTLDPKTGQFLDVLVAGENGKGFSRTLVSSPENTIALLKIGRSLVYEHCPIANGLRLTSTPATGIPGYVRVFDERNSHPSIAAVSQPQSLILAIAPKRSPPRVTI